MRTGSARILLIGCGAIGSVIARHLATSPEVADVRLADIDETFARRVASRIATEKTETLRLDASDEGSVRAAMRSCDLVVNASLPRFNPPIQKAALDAGLDYMDLATETSDPFATSDLWKSAGRTALVGMGEDPGISNVFARHAADDMDTVESIEVRDGDTASSPEHPFLALFSPETFVEETLHGSRIWRDGAYEDVPPFGAFETFEFPPPVGSLPVYSVDHEEVDTLPRTIGKGVRYVDFKLALDDGTVRALRDYGEGQRRASTPEAREKAKRAFFASIPNPADLAGRIEGYAAIVVRVVGRTGRERRVHTLHMLLSHRQAAESYGATATAYLTGTGGAVGALLLATGRVREKGVLAPEQLDPEPILAMLRERGIEVREQVETAGAPG